MKRAMAISKHEQGRAARAKKPLGKIEKLAIETIRQVKKLDNPAVEIPIRALSNVSFSEKHHLIELAHKEQSREFFNVSMAKQFMQTLLVAGACKDLLERGKTTSIRHLLYMTKHTIKRHNENT